MLQALGLSGKYSGSVTATAGSGESAHAALGFVTAVEQHDVTLNITDRFGKVPQALRFTLHRLDNTVRETRTLYDTGTASMCGLLPPAGEHRSTSHLAAVPSVPLPTAFARAWEGARTRRG
ncbi:hypothetical protein ABT026_27125 [Streptomyces sp. NPDC002734]|uniref:hypothetical protein n=1 Tax=Streptomyces sp. NPDC002734 TaxID=3154426 RepID=UPI003322CD63